MNTCFIHVGTHKTGSTSLQQYLHSRIPQIEASGYSYPRSGRGSRSAHHNIAWEITGDDRFRPEDGDIDSLLAEIEEEGRSVILSSEDFECSLHHAERFQPFVKRLQDAGFRIAFVVFLRNQIDYAESLYFEMLSRPTAIPFSEFCDEVLETGAYRVRHWIFQFAYDALLAQMEAVSGASVIVRSYDDLHRDALISEFLALVGLDPAAFGDDCIPRLNPRRDLAAAVTLFLKNHVGHDLGDPESEAIREFLDRCASRTPTMGRSRQLQFIERFGGSNREICRRYRLPAFDRMVPGIPFSDDAFSLDRIFSPAQIDTILARATKGL